MTTTVLDPTTLRGWLRRPEVLDKLTSSSWCSVGASAGTGKTYLIEHVVVEVVLSGRLPIERLLIVTYTEKAAAELRQRVRQRLRDVLEPSEKAPDGAAWRITEREQRLAAAALSRFDNALVGTIHQFCLQMLREHGVLAGMPSGVAASVVDSPFDEAWRSVLRRRIAEPDVALFWSSLAMNKRTQLVDTLRGIVGVREPIVPSLESLEQRAVAVLDSWRALGEPRMEGSGEHPFHDDPRVGGRKDRTADLDAYRAFSRALLDGLALAATQPEPGRAVMLGALAPAAAQLARRGVLERVLLGKSKGAACRSPQQRALLSEVDGLLGYATPYAAAALAPDVRHAMRQLHDERGTVTFDEMIWRLRDALIAEEDRPIGQRPLLSALRQRFALGLIDEFQDTDDRQWDIFRTVFVSARGEQRRPDGGLIVVGDPKQAIYRFRGADLEAYKRASGELLALHGGEEVHLDDNWRSTAPLLRGLDDVLEKSLFRDEGIAYRPLAARARYRFEDEEGARPVVLLAPPGYAEEEPDRRYSRSKLDEVMDHGIAAEVRRLLSDGCGVRVDDPKGDDGGSLRRLRARDICVLGRSHEDLQRVGRALARAGVGYAQYKRRGLYATAEALDLLDALIAVLDPANANDVMRAFATSFFAAPGEHLEHMGDLAPQRREMSLLVSLHALARRGDIPKLLRELEGETAVLRRLLFCEGERAATNMRHLLDEALRLHAETGWMLPRMVEELRRRVQRPVDQVSEADLLRLESERDLVTLMTMHTSKGLEYPIVFLAGGFKGMEQRPPARPEVLPRGKGAALVLNPAKDAKDAWSDADEQENARLLYVAATRAKGKLYLPFWSPAQQDRFLVAGMYVRVRPRLCEILREGGNEHVELREVKRVSAEIPPLPNDVDARVMAALSSFEPPRPPPSEGAKGRLPRLVSARRGPFQTSYTALEKRSARSGVERESAGTPPAIPLETDFSEQSDDVVRGPSEPPLSALSDDAGVERKAPDEVEVDAPNLVASQGDVRGDGGEPIHIPGSTRVGTVVHRILEELTGSSKKLAALRDADDERAWIEGDRSRFVELARLGFDEAQIDATASLLFHTLRRPFRGRAAPGSDEPFLYPPFCELAERLPELRFYFPIPETTHPLLRPSAPSVVTASSGDAHDLLHHNVALDSDSGRRFTVEKGWLTGSLDLVFRHEGRTCLVDWKTNFLRSQQDPSRGDYGPPRVAAHVDEKYRLQVAIYTLAVVRWLGIRDERSYRAKFGGSFYFYLRGSGQAGAPAGYGIFHELPTFEEVAGYEELLRTWPYQRRPRSDVDDAAFARSSL